MSDYTLFPSILPGSDEPYVDNKYSREELERMEWSEIRAIAATVESDEIDGQSDRGKMESFLKGHKRVEQ